MAQLNAMIGGSIVDAVATAWSATQEELSSGTTNMGETLALFTDLTDAAGPKPVRRADDAVWLTLPPDPRVTSARPALRDRPRGVTSRGHARPLATRIGVSAV